MKTKVRSRRGRRREKEFERRERERKIEWKRKRENERKVKRVGEEWDERGRCIYVLGKQGSPTVAMVGSVFEGDRGACIWFNLYDLDKNVDKTVL